MKTLDDTGRFNTGFSKLFFKIAPFKELKNAIARLTHLRLFFAVYLKLKNI